MKVSFKAILSKVLEYLVLSLGTLLFCAGWDCFMIPNGLSSGGITGLCAVLQYATNGVIPVDLSYAVINVILLVLGFIFLGGRFGIKTIYCIALSTILFWLLPEVEAIKSLPGHFLYVRETMLLPLIAGLMEGVGLGIILRAGGSTGGTDILAMMINKRWPVSPGQFYLVSDFIIISSILFLPDKAFSDMVYGYLMMLVSAAMVDYVVVGSKQSVQVMVFSEHYDQIADYIINDLERGVTVIKAQGWYTKKDRQVLLILVRKNQLSEVTSAIKKIDKDAFVSVCRTSSVYGEGFEEIKTGISRKFIRNGKK